MFKLFKKTEKSAVRSNIETVTIKEDVLVDCLNSLSSFQDRKVKQVTDLKKLGDRIWEFSMIYVVNGTTDHFIDLKCTITTAIYDNFLNARPKMQKLDKNSLHFGSRKSQT